METDLQRYLRKYNDLDKLTAEFGIKCYSHPTLPLVGFKYNMIDSPKYEPIVRWSRGSVLERGTWNLIAQPFKRFYNFGECEEEREKFDWSNFTVTEKVDGSLIIVYFYAGRWRINTSGSFADGQAGLYNGTWEELFCKTFPGILNESPRMDKLCSSLNPNFTYLFELCSLYNKIVTLYPNPVVFYLGSYDLKNGYELTFGEVECEAARLNLKLPKTYPFKSIAEVLDFLHVQESENPTFEGVVIRDCHNIRFKVKNEAYLRLHHMFDNGNVANPKHFVPFIVKGERAEIENYFPELKALFDEAENKIQKEWKNLLDLWKECSRIQSQKDFALSIIKRTKFSSVLFTLRKEKGLNQTQDDLQEAWANSHDLITKVIYG